MINAVVARFAAAVAIRDKLRAQYRRATNEGRADLVVRTDCALELAEQRVRDLQLKPAPARLEVVS